MNADTESGWQPLGGAKRRQFDPLSASAAWTSSSLRSPPLLPLLSLCGSWPRQLQGVLSDPRDHQGAGSKSPWWEPAVWPRCEWERRATGPAASPLSIFVYQVFARGGNVGSTLVLFPPDQCPLQSEGGRRTNGGPSSVLSWYLEKLNHSILLPFHNINQI